jgi:hypothetical protein
MPAAKSPAKAPATPVKEEVKAAAAAEPAAAAAAVAAPAAPAAAPGTEVGAEKPVTFEYGPMGMMTENKAGKITITNVLIGGQADKGAVKIGDVITGINGVACADFMASPSDTEELKKMMAVAVRPIIANFNKIRAPGCETMCDGCNGHGVVLKVHQISPGMMQHVRYACDHCGGKGKMIDPSQRCKTSACQLIFGEAALNDLVSRQAAILESIQPGLLVNIPVYLLRFTHDTIDSRLHFRNQSSIYKTFDDLQRNKMAPSDLDEPLDVCYDDGKLWSISNRRLMVLLMYQSLHRDRVVEAKCHIRDISWANYKFRKALTTKNKGLGIDPHSEPGTLNNALHSKRPLFDAGTTANTLLTELLTGSEYEFVLSVIRLRDSQTHSDAQSLTLTTQSGA